MSNHHLDRFNRALSKTPPPGSGFHPTLPGTATLAIIAGLTEDDFVEAVRPYAAGDREVKNSEIRQAYQKAVSEGYIPNQQLPENYTPQTRPKARPAAPPEIDVSQFGTATEAELKARSPATVPEDPKEMKKVFFMAAFKENNLIFCGDKFSKGELGKNIRTAKEQLQNLSEGPFFGCNSVKDKPALTRDGKPSYRCNNAVKGHRYIVVEFDDLSMAIQLAICLWLIKSGAVVSTTFSGSKSLHLLIKIDAADADDFKRIRDSLKPYLTALGADPACLHSFRLTRLPGAIRPDKKGVVQRLLYLDPDARADVPRLLAMLKNAVAWEEDAELIDPLPPQAKDCLPPAMRTITDLIEGCSQTPTDIIALALTVFTIPFLEGAVLKKSKDDLGRPPRVMVSVIGPSGCGKTTPLERLRFLYQDLEDVIAEENKARTKTVYHLQAKLKKEKDPFNIVNLREAIDENKLRHKVYQCQTGTRQGLCRMFGDGSSPLIVLDEIGRFINRADRGGTEADNMDCLTELADAGTIRPPLLKGQDTEGPTKTIYDISFSLYGTTTSEDLPQGKAKKLLIGGFFSRQTLGIIDEVNPFPEKNYLTRDEMQRLTIWRDTIMKACQDADYAFTLSDGATAILKDYRAKISSKFVISANSAEHHSGQIIRRVKQAEDIALIFHCADPETNKNKYVSGATATQATLFVDYFHERHHPKFLRFIEQGKSEAHRHAVGDRILKHLSKNDGRMSLRNLYRGLRLRKKVCVVAVSYLESKKLIQTKDRFVSLL